MAVQPPARLYVNGQWTDSSLESVIKSVSPSAPDDVVATLPAASEADVETAIRAATDAQDDWADRSAHERGNYLRRAARLVEERKADLAQLLATETGKDLASARGEVQRTLDLFDYYAQVARDYGGTSPPSTTPDTTLYTSREPMGTAGIITPWNFPIAIPAWKMAPALVAGNTVVFKPASLSPAIGAALVAVLDEAGLPDGVVNFVPGSGSTVGGELTEHPDVDVVSFTGSTAVGERVEATAAAAGKRVQCEMGGKNPLIVDESCDLDLAVQLTVDGAFGLAGQACTATSRAIVLEGVADEYVARLREAVEDLVVGDPLDEETDMGPKASREGMEEDLEYVERGVDEGATLLTGGDALDREGHFVEPTVFVDVDPTMRIAREEIFGPVLSVIEVSDFEEAVEVANGVEYGLSAAICTDRLHHAMQAADDLEAGVVKVNQTSTGVEMQLPFGGKKRSSTETYKEQGRQALDFYTHEKAVYVTDGHA